MKESYTMAEFIEEFKLGVSLHNAAATREIAVRLRELGYSPTRGMYKGRNRTYWTRKLPWTREGLTEKLNQIK